MGAGILPTCIYKNKLYFLFGKENKYADTPGFAEFGGGHDDKESHFETAIREGTEELTGFLGSEDELRKILKNTEHIILTGKIRIERIFFPCLMMNIFPIITTTINVFYRENSNQN